ncbi:MAG: dihydrolipoyl dehydrogenase [Pararhodobacter sp.]|nr:dihydrolipoyl dehydrogenase [Pararhodobacter sp.]
MQSTGPKRAVAPGQERSTYEAQRVDTIIVGSGTAGLAALREVRRYTDDFLLVNDGHWGTTCAAVGCMPSKALIEAANAFHRRHDLGDLGIRGADGLRADIPAVLARVRKLRDEFVKGPQSVPVELGNRALQGYARLNGPGRIEVDGREISARAIILAPGSSPVIPGPWKAFGNRILTSDTLFEQTDLPRRIGVIGLGAIGIEIAQALSRLGLDVAGFDAAETIAGIDDAAVLTTFRPLIEAEFAIRLGAEVQLEDTGGALRVSSGTHIFEADAVLAAIGRKPNLAGLGLETLGLPLDDRGLPQIDPETLRLGDLPVFLAGDANGFRPLLHEAADDGHIAGRMAAPDPPASGFCRRTPLAIVFSSPQVARVGPPLSGLPDDVITSEVDFSRQGRARIAATAHGVLRLYARPSDGQLLGAEMCAPAAEHLAHLLALAVEQKMRVPQLLAMPFYHPVLEEGLRSALRNLARQLPDHSASDLSDCGDIGHDALD